MQTAYQKPLDHPKESATGTLKSYFQKNNSSWTVTNETKKCQIQKKKDIYLQKKDSKLLMIFNGISKDNKFVR